VPNTSFVQHNGKHYLEVIVLRAGRTAYFLDGGEIRREEIEGLEDGAAGEQGGLENKVIIRTFALENVLAMRANGREWR
jgi:hypothetical protein